MSLFIIGSSNTDLVIYLDRIPKVGETLIGGKSNVVFGGKGANQAIAAKRAGADIKFITQLGNDSFGENLKKHFKKEGLSQRYILTDLHQPTGIAQIFVSNKGENSIAVASGSNGTLTYKLLKPYLKEIVKTDLVLIQFELPFETIERTIDNCFENGVRILVNPAPAINLTTKHLNKIWMITPNESEAQVLSGISVNDEHSALKAAQIILKKGVEHCIVTLGEKGSIWASQAGAFHFIVPKVNAIDTTAAGDVFNGYLANGITRNIALKKAIMIAHSAACLSVSVKGAQTSILNMDEVLLSLKQNPIKLKKIGYDLESESFKK